MQISLYQREICYPVICFLFVLEDFDTNAKLILIDNLGS